MRSFSLFAGLSALILTHGAVAQLITTTLPWANGNTEVLSVSTDALGDLATVTISTITEGADGEAATTAATTTTTRKGTTVKATTTTGPPTTTGQRVVGEDTTAAPMMTTTYWFDPGDGVWTVATWTASVTGAPQVATANVPAGTIQSYADYQSTVNSVVLASAEAAAASASVVSTSGADQRASSSVKGWAAMGLGAIGAVVGVLVL